jgi:hypothetical protein
VDQSAQSFEVTSSDGFLFGVLDPAMFLVGYHEQTVSCGRPDEFDLTKSLLDRLPTREQFSLFKRARAPDLKPKALVISGREPRTLMYHNVLPSMDMVDAALSELRANPSANAVEWIMGAANMEIGRKGIIFAKRVYWAMEKADTVRRLQQSRLGGLTFEDPAQVIGLLESPIYRGGSQPHDVTIADIASLGGTSYVNDKVMTYFLAKISSYKVAMISSLFCTPDMTESSLKGGVGTATCRGASGDVKAFAFAWHMRNHWALGVIHQNTLYQGNGLPNLFDQTTTMSWKGFAKRVQTVAKQVSNEASTDQSAPAHVARFSLLKNFPAQLDGYNCGIYTLIGAIHLVKFLNRTEGERAGVALADMPFEARWFSRLRADRLREQLINEAILDQRKSPQAANIFTDSCLFEIYSDIYA